MNKKKVLFKWFGGHDSRTIRMHLGGTTGSTSFVKMEQIKKNLVEIVAMVLKVKEVKDDHLAS